MRPIERFYGRLNIDRILSSPPGKITTDTLAGIGQIMLQPSAGVGGLFLIGMLFNSYWLTVFAMAGSFTGTIWAKVFGFSTDHSAKGLYGFNGALVGLALGYFYAADPALLFPTIIGSITTTVIVNEALKRDFVPLTAPFVVVTWVIMLMLANLGFPITGNGAEYNFVSLRFVDGIALGFGQVLLQENVFTGLIFAAVLFFRNRVQGLFALCATMLGVAYGLVFNFPLDVINLGIFGYNATLCAVFFAGLSASAILSSIVSVISSIILVGVFINHGWPPLAFPFVMSSWMVLWARRHILKKHSP